jgi:hypothetical protein
MIAFWGIFFFFFWEMILRVFLMVFLGEALKYWSYAETSNQRPKHGAFLGQSS